MTYVSNIQTALLVFPLIAAVFTLPYLIYQYRTYGSVPWYKTVLVFAFIFYLLCAYFMVILPLPKDRTLYVPSAAHPQLVPFDFVRDIQAKAPALTLTSPASWFRWLRSPVVYVTLFNMLLTAPFGAFMRYFFHRRWWQVLLMGFGLSLFFEISQLTGLFGLYAHPYRLFDVDDLIVNTFGAMLGFWLSIPLTHFLPSIERVNERAIEKGEQHTAATRRLLAFLIDMALVSVLACIIELVLPGVFWGEIGSLTIQVIATGIAFMLIPACTRGRTVGQACLRLRVVRPDGARAPWYAIMLRYALLFWGFLLVPRWISALVPEPSVVVPGMDEYAIAASTLEIVVFVVQVFWAATLVFRAVASAFGKPFVMLNGVMTNTRVLAEPQIDRMRRETHRPSLEEEAGDGDLGATMEDAFSDRLGDQFDDPTDEK